MFPLTFLPAATSGEASSPTEALWPTSTPTQSTHIISTRQLGSVRIFFGPVFSNCTCYGWQHVPARLLFPGTWGVRGSGGPALAWESVRQRSFPLAKICFLLAPHDGLNLDALRPWLAVSSKDNPTSQKIIMHRGFLEAAERQILKCKKKQKINNKTPSHSKQPFLLMKSRNIIATLLFPFASKSINFERRTSAISLSSWQTEMMGFAESSLGGGREAMNPNRRGRNKTLLLLLLRAMLYHKMFPQRFLISRSLTFISSSWEWDMYLRKA